MKNKRFQFEYRKSASKLHKLVGDTLRASPIFQNYHIYQEYPVCRVNPSYQDTSHHFDWVLPDIMLVIEAHGKQHYEVTDFSGKQEDGGLSNFHAGRARDEQKKQAALSAGYTYIIISYADAKLITDNFIWDLYKANENKDLALTPDDSQKVKPLYNKEKRQEYLKSDRHKSLLAKSREARKEAYRRAKEKKNGSDNKAKRPLYSRRVGKDEP